MDTWGNFILTNEQTLLSHSTSAFTDLEWFEMRSHPKGSQSICLSENGLNSWSIASSDGSMNCSGLSNNSDSNSNQFTQRNQRNQCNQCNPNCNLLPTIFGQGLVEVTRRLLSLHDIGLLALITWAQSVRPWPCPCLVLKQLQDKVSARTRHNWNQVRRCKAWWSGSYIAYRARARKNVRLWGLENQNGDQKKQI